MRPDSTAALAQLLQLRPRLQEDFVDSLLGAVLLTVGIATLGLGAFRARSTSRPLLYLGTATCLYGLRLVLSTDILDRLVGIPQIPADYVIVGITYVLPLLATLFVEWALGPGWHSSIRAVRYLQIAYAVVAILIDAVREPAAAMGINNLIVLAALAVLLLNGALYLKKNPGVLKQASRTRSGRVIMAGSTIFLILVLNENLVEAGLVPWGVSPEPLGILALVVSLVYAFAHRVFDTERRLAGISQELETARRIQSSILPRQMPAAKGIKVAARYLPMADVGGDFYDFLLIDPARLGILVADVSGHGVPAALIASMVKIALAAQAENAADPAAVLAGMNKILHGHLERGFVTAAYAFLEAEALRVTCAGAGHPPLLVWRSADQTVEEIGQESLPLGRFVQAVYRNRELSVAAGDRLLLYTDGVPDAMNPAGEPFGEKRLKEVLSTLNESPEPFAESLLRRLGDWSGRGAGEPLDDDVTLVVAEILGPLEWWAGAPVT